MGLLQWICCCCSREPNVVNNYSVINPNPLLAQERNESSEERIEDVKECTTKQSLGKNTDSPQSGVGVEYNLEELETITRNFSQLLHTGHSGLFYQGIIGGEDIEAGNTQVVVKRITEGNYLEELSVFNQLTKSRFVVELIGYCSEGGYQYLVFQSMNSDLSRHFGSSTNYLDGRTCIMIARDLADGLTYLHNECAMAHRDIQPSSVLLDKNLRARLGSLNKVTENRQAYTEK
ncbi:probable LRR receptor-like serine/threonine-protein kinase At2g16250 [Papaver somniferum]|uniref:probable LRR receptor-like serine/threonine-protein kinase At2g16250 n=1 Tax=Papaver somniferum TaxID=3469 RepID=UPI000E6F7F18|nr:probable LRR receptor-like serine/threonine-protein kinase At2g16250 [Papaver somniferum]